MVKRTRKRRRGSTTKKRSYKKRKTNYDNRRTGGYMGKELKFLDCAWNGVSVDTSTTGGGGEMQPSAGSINCLSCPAAGTGESQRLGRTYRIKNAFVSGVISTSPDGDRDDVVSIPGYFVALILDTQANKATIISSDIYVNPTSSVLGMLPSGLRNLQNTNRFRVLDSKYITCGGAYAGNDTAITQTVAVQRTPIFSLSWKGDIKVECVGTDANVSSVSDNAMHIVAYAGSTTFTPLFIGKSRIRYTG